MYFYFTGSEYAAPLSLKQADDLRERQIPQVGKVHDPIKDTLNVDKDHVFGILVKHDPDSAGDLMHMRNTGSFMNTKTRERGAISAVRYHLKKANFQNFKDLKSAFMFYDKVYHLIINIYFGVVFLYLAIYSQNLYKYSRKTKNVLK